MMKTFDFSELEMVCKQKAMLFGKSGRERLATVIIIDIDKKKTSRSRSGKTLPTMRSMTAIQFFIILLAFLEQIQSYRYCKVQYLRNGSRKPTPNTPFHNG